MNLQILTVLMELLILIIGMYVKYGKIGLENKIFLITILLFLLHIYQYGKQNSFFGSLRERSLLGLMRRLMNPVLYFLMRLITTLFLGGNSHRIFSTSNLEKLEML